MRQVLNWKAALIVIPVTIIAAAVIFFVTRPQDPFRGDAITDPPFTSLTYGIQAFLWWDGGEVGQNLEWVRMMMFTHVKQTFAWVDLEPVQGEWHFERADSILDEADARNLKIVARLGDVPEWAAGDRSGDDVHDTPPANMEDWANYCGTIAGRYKGRIVAYQVWNEPNLSREWGGFPPDAAGYTDLLRVCSEAIHAADPDAIVISAGLAPTGNHDEFAQRDDLYLQAMYDAGFQRYADVVGVHAPGFAAPEYGPDDAERDGKGRWATFRRVEDLRKIMVANGDASRQMAILEVGYTTDTVHPDYAWYRVDEETQGKYLRGAYEYAAENWRPWVGLMSSIYLAKPVWTEADEEYWWAITFPGPEPGQIFTRPAFNELTIMPKYCGDIVTPLRDPGAIPREPDNPCS